MNENALDFESVNLITGVEVYLRNGRYWMYYPAFGTKDIPSTLGAAGFPQVWAINLAVKDQY